jgi:hypothetical protein
MRRLIPLSFLLAGCAAQPSHIAPAATPQPEAPRWEQTSICRKHPATRFCLAQLQSLDPSNQI